MANTQGKRIENLLEREQREKKRERYERSQAKSKAKNGSLAPKVDRENILKGLMGQSEQEIRVKLSEAKARTDNAIEALNNAEDKLNLAEKHYKGDNVKEAFKELREEVARLTREVSNAKKVEQCLEGFQKNGEQVTKIYNIEQRAIIRKKKNLQEKRQELSKTNHAIAELKVKINENDKEIKTLRQREQKADKEIKELVRKTEKFGQGQDEITPEQSVEQIENLKKISELSSQKDIIGKELKEKQSDKTVLEAIANKARLEKRAKELRTKIKLYEKGESDEDKAIHKCRMARQMLLAGKSWFEINLASVKEIEERQNKTEETTISEHESTSEPKKSEEKPEPTAEPKSELEPEQESIHTDSYIEPTSVESEPLPPMPEKFEERHPRLAKIPFLAKFANKFMEAKRRIMAKNEKPEEYVAEEYVPGEKDEAQEAHNLQSERQTSTRPQPVRTAIYPDEYKTHTRAKRDRFIEYLREAVEGEHTEQYKYSTREGLKDKEMRDRIDVRTQKEAGRGETENREQSSDGREPGDN